LLLTDDGAKCSRKGSFPSSPKPGLPEYIGQILTSTIHPIEGWASSEEILSILAAKVTNNELKSLGWEGRKIHRVVSDKADWYTGPYAW
jgi:hypothetical protein